MELECWYNRRGGRFFKFDRPFDEGNPFYNSYASLKNGVFSMTLVNTCSSPVNEAKSSNSIGRALKALFGSKAYICIVKQLNARKGSFKYIVEFYTKVLAEPSLEVMRGIYKAVEDNVVERLFVKVDPQTSEVIDIYSYEDLSALGSKPQQYKIVAMCEGVNKYSKKTHKRLTILGSYWEYQ